MYKSEYLAFYNLFDKLDRRCNDVFNKLKNAGLLYEKMCAEYLCLSLYDIEFDKISVPYSIDESVKLNTNTNYYYDVPVDVFFDDKLLDEFIHDKVLEIKKIENEQRKKHIKEETEKELKELKRLQQKYKNYIV